MQAHVRKTVLGSLISILFRPSHVTLGLQYADGKVEQFRLITGIAQEGFFISPTIRTSEEFAELAVGRSDGRDVSAITFQTGRLGRWLYEREIELAFQEAHIAPATVPAAIGRQIENKRALQELLASSPGVRDVRFISQGLLAAPPAMLSRILTERIRGLEIGFGIVDAAWTIESGTDGVCFEVWLQQDGKSIQIFERCLDPKRKPEDRGPQTERITLGGQPGATLQFQTKCRVGCDYGWSYWSTALGER
jgi:hypothetical protein